MRPLARSLLLVLLLLPGLLRAQEEEEADPPQVAVGERLFLETRFAQYFFAHSGGDPNAVLAVGDPVVAGSETPGGSIAGPFVGQSMNCRACHLVDDAKATPGGGNRSYADFARRSPVPARGDGRTHAPRNSPSLVNASLARNRPFILHFDGEFPSPAALVEGTLTGRNFGWLPDEKPIAVRHIAAVIRGDDGSGQLARDFGGPYRRVLRGTDRALPPELRLGPRFRLDVDRASDEHILRLVSRLIAAYVESLEFGSTSPYDAFLAKNVIPGAPVSGESERVYLERLRLLLARLDAPEFVGEADGPFQLHGHPFVFGPRELEGLRLFLDPKRANCVACHPPPRFTDFAFHNTGASQDDYDAAHRPGSFAALPIPDLAARNADPDAYLPASAAHPRAREPFRSAVSLAEPGRTDLGVWNVLLNPDVDDRRLQRRLARLVCASRGGRACSSPTQRLETAVALFKTPGLRDLGHSGPYLHGGRLGTLEEVVTFYVEASALARAGAMRNPAPELSRMTVSDGDVPALAAFLRSLDEDYE